MTINTFLEDNVKEIPDAFQPPIESKSWKWIDISISRFCTPFICRGRHFIVIFSTKSKDLTTAEITKICTLDHINSKYFHDNTNFYLFQKKNKCVLWAAMNNELSVDIMPREKMLEMDETFYYRNWVNVFLVP